jgi:DNA processing protein
MQLTTFFNKDSFSPFEEFVAYEALWDQEDATVKNISQKFRHYHFAWPSKLLPEENKNDLLATYKKKITKIFDSHFSFEICFAGEFEFPKKLLEVSHPSPLFYYQGDLSLLSTPTVSVVGTRSPSPEGIKRTQKLVTSLIKDGYTIMSGLARGIDTAAHQTAIEKGGKTVAIIGTPITECYPKENSILQEKIAKYFLVISQVPFLKYQKQDFRQNRFFFPERNKVMSALSQATIIVEAGETSGTLIQAKEAFKQGRKVFILDSCFKNTTLTWPAKLESQGAIRVKEYEDIQRVLGQHG